MKVWIVRRLQVYGRVCLVGAVFLPPLVFNRRAIDVFVVAKMTTLWILGILALAAWLVWSAERRVWLPRFRLLYAVAAFLGVCALATAISSNPIVSVLGLYKRYNGLVPFTLYAAIMVSIAGLYWEHPENLKEIVWAAAAASVVMAGYVLVQAAGWDWISWPEHIPGKKLPFPFGTLGNSNFAGAYLGITLPCILYGALAARRRVWKRIWLAMVALDLVALWFTQTRGGMIAAGAALATVAFMLRDRLARWAKAAVMSVTVLAVAAAVLVIWHPGSSKPPGPLLQAQVLRTGSFTVRTYYWKAAWRMFLAHPVAGTGLETYFANYPRYRVAADGAQLGLVIPDEPHSIFFQYAADTGVLGLGAYLALVGLALWYAYRRAQNVAGPQRLLLVTFAATLVSYLAQGAVSIDMPPLATMGWVALGGIAALADPKILTIRDRITASARQKGKGKRMKSGDRAHSAPLRWPIHTAIAIAVAALVVLGTQPVLADMQARSGQLHQTANAPAAVTARYFDRATELNPLEPSYRYLSGLFSEITGDATSNRAEKKRLLGKALIRYREAERLHPRNIHYLVSVARVTTFWAQTIDPRRFEEADSLWAKIVADDPTDWEVHSNYAGMLEAWASSVRGDPAIRNRADAQLEEVARIRSSFPQEAGAH